MKSMLVRCMPLSAVAQAESLAALCRGAHARRQKALPLLACEARKEENGCL